MPAASPGMMLFRLRGRFRMRMRMMMPPPAFPSALAPEHDPKAGEHRNAEHRAEDDQRFGPGIAGGTPGVENVLEHEVGEHDRAIHRGASFPAGTDLSSSSSLPAVMLRRFMR